MNTNLGADNLLHSPIQDGKGLTPLPYMDIAASTLAEGLEHSEHLYRQLLEGLPVAFYICDAEGRLTYYNERAKELWGRAPELGKDKWCGSWKIFAQDGTQVDLEDCPMGIALRTGKAIMGEQIVIEREDGIRHDVLPHPQPFLSKDGKIVGAFNILVDITEQTRKQHELYESEARFRSIANTAPVMIWVAEIDAKRSFFNTSWLNFTGRTLSENQGDRWLENLHPEDKETLRSVYMKAFEERRIYETEFRMRRHDGEYRNIAAIGVPRFSNEHVFLGYVGSCIDITDQKAAQQELERKVQLRTSELQKKNEKLEKQTEFINSIIDSSPSAIVVFDKDIRYKSVNQKALMFLARPKEEVIGKKFIEISPEAIGTEFESLLQDAFILDQPSILLQIKSAVSERIFDTHIIPLRDDKNRVFAVMVMADDTTVMRQMTDQIREANIALTEKNTLLKQSEERYSRMIEEVRDYSIILLDKEGIIQNWNKGVQAIKGYSAEEIIGQHFRVFFSAKDQNDHVPEILIHEAETNGRAVREGWRVRKDGTIFWGSAVMTALHDEQNNVIGFTKMTRDLTERKAAEDALKENAQTLQEKNDELQQQKEFVETLLDASVDLICVYDRESRMISYNKKCGETLGFNKEETLGKTFTELFPGDAAKETFDDIQKSMNGEYTNRVYISPLPTGYSYDIYTIPLLHNNNVYAVLVITHDITNLVQMAEKVQRTNQLLKLKNEDLEKSNKELEQFAHIASHDLQEPLRKISTFATRLGDKADASLDNTSMEYLHKIMYSSKRMSDLIQAVLNYSSLRQTAKDFMKTDLNTTLQNIVTDFDLLIEEKNAVITWDGLPVIEVIPQQMSQLFSNLLSNSLKFAKKDIAPHISITSRSLQPNEIVERSLAENLEYVHIEFTDNGIGFEQAYAEKIFTVFQRLHGKEKFEGTGIGLSLCRKIVAGHGGVIYAISEEQQGTTFHIILPIKHKKS